MHRIHQKQRVYLSSPTMHGDEQRFVQEAFDTNWVAPLGANVDGFEKEICAYTGSAAAAALTAGTAALHLAIKLAGVSKGTLFFCSDLTFSATVNPVSYEKGTQVLIDSERDTWNMDPNALKKAFQFYDGVKKPRPKAVVLVHLYGTPAKLADIMALCEEYNVPLIEDAAESLSATYRGKQTGTFGKYGVYSFNGNKIITSSGGGMLVSDRVQDIQKARFWSTQSRDPAPHYQHSELGYNYRMSNIVAGIGRGQLLHIEEHRDKKEEIYRRYARGLEDISCLSLNPYDAANSKPNFWLSCLLLDKNCPVTPTQIMEALGKENIEARPIWKPMHMQPFFSDKPFISMEEGDGVGGDIFHRGLCLPSDIKMTAHAQDNVIKIINSLF